MRSERIDKIISSAGSFSRRDVAKMCSSGDITVNGSPVRSASAKIDPDVDKISVRGKEFIYKEHVYIMLNKPAGVISATDGKGERTVTDLIPDELRRPGLFPAGRLDKDTVGLVLITDDGGFAHQILSPKRHIEKVYIFNTDSPLTPEGLDRIRTGTSGFAPAKIVETGNCSYRIILTEGKYHEIKLLARAAGGNVTFLKRIKMGDLELDPDLAEGECKEIDRNDILRLP